MTISTTGYRNCLSQVNSTGINVFFFAVLESASLSYFFAFQKDCFTNTENTLKITTPRRAFCDQLRGVQSVVNHGLECFRCHPNRSLRSLAVFKQFEGVRKGGSRDRERQSREEPGRETTEKHSPLVPGFAALKLRSRSNYLI